jgi:hypothetical protein
VIDVLKRLQRLDPYKAYGVDGIHPRVLKECAIAFASPVTFLFRRSIDTGVVPELWRRSNVTPIFKKGSKSKASNYRPVSLTCVLGKVMEAIIHDHIVGYCDSHGLISKSQHGFRKHKSCATNLVETRDVLSEALHRGLSVDVVFTDFAKAFDRVPHDRLLLKLALFGICGPLLDWIRAWLSGRWQRVVLGCCESDWKRVTSGVPQGSVLGPLLFVLFINDLCEVIQSHIKLYADDSKIFRIIESEEDPRLLQADIDAAVEWSGRWLLPFNLEKCKVMHVGTGRKRSAHVYTMISNDGSRHVLETTDLERDLGVLLSRDLKVSAQVDAVVSRANSELGRLKKSFQSRDESLWKTLYTTYVLPHLEYAVVSWAPHLKSDVVKLENVQRRATKTITALRHESYSARLDKLGLITLKARRQQADLIQQFKISHGIEELDFLVPQAKPLWQAAARYTLRGHSLSLRPQRVLNCEERRAFFTNRVVSQWNALSEDVVCVNSVPAFKGRINSQIIK